MIFFGKKKKILLVFINRYWCFIFLSESLLVNHNLLIYMGLRFKSATLAENIGHLLKIMFCKNEIVLIITLNYSSLNYIF